MKEEDQEELIKKMDEMLLSVGLKYSGFQNMYIPQDRKRRDDIVFDAIHMLETCDWSKESKMAYYEKYYLKTNKLPHSILVDENDCLADGYVSYLLTQKYKLRQNIVDGPEIYHIESDVTYKKIVAGRHVTFDKDDITIKSENHYKWIYDLKTLVVPGKGWK